jgi:hypothetical protein
LLVERGTVGDTSTSSIPNRGRGRALGAVAVVAVGVVGAYASVTGAQSATDPILLDVVSVDAAGAAQLVPDTVVPAISDTGAVVAYEAVVPADPTAASGSIDSRIWIRDRVGATSRPVAETSSANPGISGNGCVVAYTVVGADSVTLTVVDRCATPIDDPLPIGTVVDTVPIDVDLDAVADADADASGGPDPDADVDPDPDPSAGTDPDPPAETDPDADAGLRAAAPALSFDGSTIVWSTGTDVRRYARPGAGGPHARSHIFDAVADGAPDIATGAQLDVSADGSVAVFVAGPGTTPFAPTPANVYLWNAATPQLEPTLISASAFGDPGASDSTSPTISADGSFVVFESSAIDLSAVGTAEVTTPFVVGVDLIAETGQILVDDASRPSVSADGNHVVFERSGAVRVLSSDVDDTVDQGIDELAAVHPTGGVAISQFGRWIVFGGAEDLVEPSTDTPAAASVVWAADRKSSSTEVVDTTTTTTTTTTSAPSTSTTTTSTPPTTTSSTPSDTTTTAPDTGTATTAPSTTLAPTVTTPRFPTRTDRFPSIGFPRTTRPTVRSSSLGNGSGSSFDPAANATAVAGPVSFEPTVINAGRRTQPVMLTNPTARSLRIAATTIDTPEVFSVVLDSCTGTSLAPGASCSVEVQFAPVAVGQAVASAAFQLGDGSIVTASLAGYGAPEPTLDLLPAVAGAGQTVTAFGVGFPPGSTIEFSQPGSTTSEAIVVDVDGTFAHVVVVLPNTPTGPALLSVVGQPGVFDGVTAELLVSSRGGASGDAALRGGLAGALRR